MGSLMAGWDSNVQDPKQVKYQRNRSLTREQIDIYWNTKKQTDQENTKVGSEEEVTVKESTKTYKRSRTLPLTDNRGSLLDKETEDEDGDGLERLILRNGWWMGTSSAFLNERPVIEPEQGGNQKYASQFHVAGSGASKAHHSHTGIST